jgi:hypothetical protein
MIHPRLGANLGDGHTGYKLQVCLEHAVPPLGVTSPARGPRERLSSFGGEYSDRPNTIAAVTIGDSTSA